jgi:hypothetical protein
MRTRQRAMLLHFLCICSSIYANFEHLLAYLSLSEVLAPLWLSGNTLATQECVPASLLIPRAFLGLPLRSL